MTEQTLTITVDSDNELVGRIHGEIEAIAETSALDGYIQALMDVEELVDQVEASVPEESQERAAPYIARFREELETLERDAYKAVHTHVVSGGA